MSELHSCAEDMPYPTLEGITVDSQSARIISSAYAGLYGELTAILQYEYQVHYFDAFGDLATRDMVECIALAEMHHFEILGELLLKLGTDPIYTLNPPKKYNYYTTAQVSTSKTPQTMLLASINGEMMAIEDYESMLERLENERVSAVIERILLDEKLHLKMLKAAYNKL